MASNKPVTTAVIDTVIFGARARGSSSSAAQPHLRHSDCDDCLYARDVGIAEMVYSNILCARRRRRAPRPF